MHSSPLCVLLLVLATAAVARSGEVLFINQTGEAAMSRGDRALKARLVAMGHRVTVRDHFAEPEAANGMQLIFISETVFAVKLGTRFRDVAVPCVVSDCHVFPGMGMSGAVEKTHFGFAGKGQTVVIGGRSHPIANALTDGKIEVFKIPVTLHWGLPTSGGATVATSATEPPLCLLFTYETGAEMAGIRAPARRVGMFIRDHHDDATHLTDAGWKLFEASINWALGRL